MGKVWTERCGIPGTGTVLRLLTTDTSLQWQPSFQSDLGLHFQAFQWGEVLPLFQGTHAWGPEEAGLEGNLNMTPTALIATTANGVIAWHVHQQLSQSHTGCVRRLGPPEVGALKEAAEQAIAEEVVPSDGDLVVYMDVHPYCIMLFLTSLPRIDQSHTLNEPSCFEREANEAIALIKSKVSCMQLGAQGQDGRWHRRSFQGCRQGLPGVGECLWLTTSNPALWQVAPATCEGWHVHTYNECDVQPSFAASKMRV
jgi:hypothetical protein